MSMPIGPITKASSAHREATFRTGLQHKLRGNEAFKSGDIKGALSAYHFAILHLSHLESRGILGLVAENSGEEATPEDLSSDEEQDDSNVAGSTSLNGESGTRMKEGESEKELSIVYANMAMCSLKQQNYRRAIESAEKALKSDSKNVKAKFRKAQALRLGGDVYKAKRYLEEVLEGFKSAGKKKMGDEEVVKDFEKELATVVKSIEAREAAGRNKWKGFLGKNPKVFDVGAGDTAKEGDAAAASQGKEDKGEEFAPEASST